MKTSSKVARGIAVTAVAAAGGMSLTVPSAMAAEVPQTSLSSISALGPHESFGRLGPLTDLVIERLLVSDDVAASKFGTDSPIENPVREQQVLDQVRAQADALGLDPDDAVAFFRDQITASKEVQTGLFARWTAHPDQAPTTRPDLEQIRLRLDQLTTALLQQLAATVDVRDKPIACTVHLALAVGSGTVLEGLNTLHRQALGTAVRSVCTAAAR
ncbi:chorismate mutase [Kribbella lupini]|uniref:chorismate mutase n=1 Tax=Kribbella lupini TaxID=291602 RepID=A0ABN2CNR1_9ACTN